MNIFKKALIALVAVFALTVTNVQAGTATADTPRGGIERAVYKKLIGLPYYNVFDHLAFEVVGNTVILSGSVVRPTTKSSAERRVEDIEGVEVINNIKVLPLSPFDDEIRFRTLRSISNTAGLYRYFLGANPSIRIIVDRGNVTLEGFVANKGDRNLANIAARQVPNSFSVTNNLRLDNEEAE